MFYTVPRTSYTMPYMFTYPARIAFCLSCMAAFGLASCRAQDTGASPPRRVLWITIDSLRADHLGYMGYGRATSSNLDALARESVDFRLAIAPSNITRRSVVAYLTGKNYSVVHEDPMEIGLPEQEISIAEAFKAAGFKTTGLTANFFLRPEEGHRQGYDDYFTVYACNQPYGTIDEVIEVLNRSYKPTPDREFVYVHIMDVHHPYRPPIPYGAEFTAPYTRRTVREGNLCNEDGTPVVGILPPYNEKNDVTQEDLDFLMSLYDGAIQYTDARFPALLEALGYDPAQDMLVVTADHGEQFCEHGFWRHGPCLTMEEIHVPLLVRLPGAAPAQVPQPASLLDLYPTFCDLFGLARPEGLCGTSLAPVLRGETPGDRTVYCETPDGTGPAAAVVSVQFLYWLYADVQYIRPFSLWPFDEALFDHAQDPGCTKNLVATQGDTAAALNAALRRLNPRWDTFTRERISGSEAAVELGPDLLAEAWPQVATPAIAANTVTPEGRFRINTAAPEIRVPAMIDAPGDAYFFAVDCLLTSGSVVFEICDAASPDTPLWRFECRKPSGQMKQIRTRVYPKSGQIEVVVRQEEPGQFELAPPTLRHATLPKMPVVSPQARDAVPDENAGTNDEEQQRLTTLGYFQ